MAASIEEMAYDLSLHAIGQQESRATELRSRTGTLLAAAAVTASFFGAQAVAAQELDAAGVLALLAFLSGVVAGLVVLRPHSLVLEFRGSVVLHAARTREAQLADAYEAATAWIEKFHEANRRSLERLARWYTAALTGVGVEIVLWTVSVSGNLF